MEARVARSIRTISLAGALLEDVELLRELERILEWFFTWRLKLAETPAVMWCDGVIDLAIHSRGDLSYEIQAKAYIGPESEANTTLCAEAALPGPLKSDAIAAEVDPERKVKLLMAQQMKIMALQQTITKRPSRNRLVRYRAFLRGELLRLQRS